MDNQIPKESLLFVAVLLGGYAASALNAGNVLYGIGAAILTAGVIVLRAYLKKLGWDIAGKK